MVKRMTSSYNIQNIVKHMINGTCDVLCRICLLPLDEYYEDMFTTVCKSDKEYCIADILEKVCCIKVLRIDQSKICHNCFMAASEAYKFYLKTQSTEEVLNYYANEICRQLDSVDIPESSTADTLCLSLPIINAVKNEFNIDVRNVTKVKKLLENNNMERNPNILPRIQGSTNKVIDKDSDNILIVVNDKNKPTCYKSQNGSSVTIVNKKDSLKKTPKQQPKLKSEKKLKRKRNPMSFVMCSKCPIQYRFIGKLKQHMKNEHGIDLFMCKVCKAIIENESEFNKHLQTHEGIHTCALCNAVFKKRKSIITHLKWHEEMKSKSKEGMHICEICGMVLFSEELLEEHKDKKHVNKFTCYYCGRMYKVEKSFEAHIKKHELHMKNGNGSEKQCPRPDKKGKRKLACSKCGKELVDERALLWHERLHAGERPYACGCGKRFVSLNRRNQHALCAHTAPARRCPLCPALFHLRSMVNSHIKKVHLHTHKRRARGGGQRHVYWKTEPVPLQELSVAVQDDLFRLRSARDHEPAVQREP